MGPILLFDPRREHSSVPIANCLSPPRRRDCQGWPHLSGHPQGLALIGPSAAAYLVGVRRRPFGTDRYLAWPLYLALSLQSCRRARGRARTSPCGRAKPRVLDGRSTRRRRERAAGAKGWLRRGRTNGLVSVTRLGRGRLVLVDPRTTSSNGALHGDLACPVAA